MSRPLANDDFVGVAEVLSRTASTCGELATSIVWLQDQLSSMVESGSLTPTKSISLSLQELDRSAQVLYSLERLNSTLGDFVSTTAAPKSELSKAINLESLETRILEEIMNCNADDELWS